MEWEKQLLTKWGDYKALSLPPSSALAASSTIYSKTLDTKLADSTKSAKIEVQYACTSGRGPAL